MVDFVTAFATAGNAIKLVTELRSIQKAFDEAEWKLKVAELNGALADLKNALIDAKQELGAKDEEIKILGNNFLIFKETVEVSGHRYDKKTHGQPTGHPYCPVCLQKDGYMFHTTMVWGEVGRPEQCPNCKAKYQTTVYA
jgi:rubrerythrin